MQTIYCKILFLPLLFAGMTVGSIPVRAQGDMRFLRDVEQNNTTLKALRESTEAQQLANKTGAGLPNPDVGVDYFWGAPAATGNRTDFSLRQSFDVATLTGMKSRAADRQNRLVDMQFRADRMAILQEAALYGVEIIYYNILRKELFQRLRYAEMLVDGYAKRLQNGYATMPEYHKAKRYLSSTQGELARADVERAALLAELQRLNGGITITLDDDSYGDDLLPSDFESWFADVASRHPALEYARQDVVYNKQNRTLNRAQNWPSFSVGFVSEQTVGQRYQGVSLGLSIPLWENRRRVKQAAAAVRAAEARQTDAALQLYTRLQTACYRAQSLRAIAAGYRQSQTSADNTERLQKALDAGEISLLEYLMEMELYYAALQQTLDAERDYRKAATLLLVY
ncbi:MAG: TolC family protein [Prevotellaceae bacterium]|jgi:outer membrane protein TolC|nr:TolC family protein [Prevotellaceae bacterium]